VAGIPVAAGHYLRVVLVVPPDGAELPFLTVSRRQPAGMTLWSRWSSGVCDEVHARVQSQAPGAAGLAGAEGRDHLGHGPRLYELAMAAVIRSSYCSPVQADARRLWGSD
jgi:hypothetical protein